MLHSLYAFIYRIMSTEHVETLTSTIQAILDCELDKVPMEIYLHFFMVKTWIWDKSIKMRPYKSCTKVQRNITESVVRKCLPLLIGACRKSPIRVVKTIRLRMDMVPKLIDKVPDIKIIHQTRDPRGLLNSWWRMFHGKQPNEAETDSKLVCSWLSYDCRSLKKLSSSYPGVFFSTKFEELVSSPMKTVTRIYNSYLNLDIPESIYKWVWKSTHSTKDNGNMGTARKNSVNVATKWRAEMNLDFLNFTMGHCKKAIEEMGYDLIY